MFFGSQALKQVAVNHWHLYDDGDIKEVVRCISEKFQRAAVSEPAAFNVKDMPSEGQAKVRHVGAWAIRKVANDHHKYVRSNKVTNS